jgi:signal transduction histidine kinase/ActR/RegA family two-component response regulator
MLASIRTRLLLLMMTVLLPGIAAALVMVARTYQNENEAVLRGLHDSALAMAQVVDRELIRRKDLALALAGSYLLVREPGDDPDLSFTHARTSRIAQELGGWIQLVSASQVLMDTREPAASPPRTHGEGGFLMAEEPVIRPLTRTASGMVQPPLVVQPLRRPGGELLNLVIAVPAEVLQRAIDHQRLPLDWVGTVLDSNLSVVARQPGGAAHVGRPATADLRAQMVGRTQGAFRSVTLDGVPVQGYFSKTPQGWTYLTAAPRSAGLAGVPAEVLEVLAGALLLLAAAVAGALGVGRGIAGGVGSIERAAQALQDGAPAVRPERTGITELDAVGQTLAHAARALTESRDELQQQVAEAVTRTRLAEQRIAQGQRIGALGRLTGGVAHDFNNLLGVISNSAHLVQHHAEKLPALQMPVSVMLRAVETGSHLTQQLLRFGGRQPVSPQPVDLAAHLPEMRELLQMVMGRRVGVGIEVQPGTAAVHIDTGELELALINIAFNARDAMPQGGRLQVQARNASPEEAEGLPPGPYVLVAVADNGLGMDEALAAQVFEPFFTTKATGAGSGLGLSQVYGFCQQAGGTARMASTPGLGSTVMLLLPACAQAVGLPPHARAAEGALTLAGVSVLLVEDSEALAEVTAVLLQSYGCAVRVAHDAEDALAQVQADPALQLVLSDVVMPGGRDGVALARELRRIRPGLPVVLISGYSAGLAGVTDFTVLRKPVAADHLVRTLMAALRDRPPAARRDSATPGPPAG